MPNVFDIAKELIGLRLALLLCGALFIAKTHLSNRYKQQVAPDIGRAKYLEALTMLASAALFVGDAISRTRTGDFLVPLAAWMVMTHARLLQPHRESQILPPGKEWRLVQVDKER